jgi:hypothetical protein
MLACVLKPLTNLLELYSSIHTSSPWLQRPNLMHLPLSLLISLMMTHSPRLSYRNMTNTTYIIIARLTNVRRPVQQREGIDLRMPGIGTMERKYLKTGGSVGSASLAGRLKNSLITQRIQTGLSQNILKMYTRLSKTT